MALRSRLTGGETLPLPATSWRSVSMQRSDAPKRTPKDLPRLLEGEDMRSMTGYGEARAANARYELAVSIRAVNHRFLDLQLRIDEAQRGVEGALRSLLGGEIARGRVETRIDARPIDERPVRIEVKKAVVEAAHDMVQQLATRSE